MATQNSPPRRPRSKANRKPVRKTGEWWSQRIPETSGVLTLRPKLFSAQEPRAIALSLKWSAEHSQRPKASPYRSAMSMLTFYINRAGKKLPKARLRVLEKAKEELRDLFQRPR